MKIKVVHIIAGTDVGGAELMLKRLILHEKSRSVVDHEVISLTSIGLVGRELQDNNITVTALGAYSWRSGLGLIFRIIDELKKRPPDVVHTWMYHSDLLGGVAAKLCRVSKIIWCIRSNDISKGGSRLTLLVRKLCAIVSRLVPDKVVCAANVSKETHVALGYDERKMVVIPNGFEYIDIEHTGDRRERVRSSFCISPTTIAIVSVARYNKVKDHATFIKAASQLLAKHYNIIFVLVGRGNTANNNELLGTLRKYNVEEKFLLLGEVDNPSDYLLAGDIFCLHSITEGFPNALGEAMLCGLPCVTTDVGDAGFLLGDPNYIVPPSDPAAMSRLLEQLIDMSGVQRRALGLKLRVRILNNFTMDTVINRYLDVYES